VCLLHTEEDNHRRPLRAEEKILEKKMKKVLTGTIWTIVGTTAFCLWMYVWIQGFGFLEFFTATIWTITAICLAFRKNSADVEKALVGVSTIMLGATAWIPFLLIWCLFAVIIVGYTIACLIGLIAEGWGVLQTHDEKTFGLVLACAFGFIAWFMHGWVMAITLAFIIACLFYLKAIQLRQYRAPIFHF
jgi:hypothetical protein